MRPAIRLLAILTCVAGVAHAEAPARRAPAPANPAPKPQTPTKAPPKDPLANTTMLPAIQVESLTLTPIVATVPPDPKGKIDVLVLDEAMAAKKVRIREIADESVNDLTFINKSEQPVFILAGEVIIGGKQDRIIGANTIIPANTTQSVPVFCVEHGRWDNSSKEFTTAKALAHGRLRGKASYEAQGAVWQEVAAKNQKRKTTNDTDTYRKVAQQQSDGSNAGYTKKIGEALAKIPPADRARMVGYVIALNGKVATVDMFQSPRLFRKLETKLLKSYVTEAIDIVASKDAKPPTKQMVYDFIDDAEKAPEERAYDTAASSTMRKSGVNAGKARVMMLLKSKASAGQPPAAAPADEDAVYLNYQAK